MNAKTTARIARIAKVARIAHVAKLARVASIAGLALGAVALPVSPAFALTAPSVIEERLYGTSQWGTFPLANINGTSTMAFDDATSSMTGQFAQPAGSDWTYGTLQQTSLKSIQSAAIEVRFATAGWKDDEFVLEYSTDGWASAKPLATYGAANPAPSALQTVTFANLQGVLNSPQAVNAVQVRFRTAPKATTQASVPSGSAQPSGGNDRARSEHRDNGKGNEDKARQDNRGGNNAGSATSRIAAAPTTSAISTTGTVTNTPETYTLSVDQVRLVVKGS